MYRKLYFFLVVVVLVGVVGCQVATPTPAPKPVIRLIVNPWPTSELNVEVARQLMEQRLGYQVKKLHLDTNVQWASLAEDQADANLEVWPSSHVDNIQKFVVEDKSVEDGGLLGPQGLAGWYIPQYMVDERPELAQWESYQQPELASLFDTPDTPENKGQLLFPDPSWITYDKDIIFNLGLHLEVVVAGSEENLLLEVKTAYEQKKPILFYFYEPHALFAKYDLVQVALPEYTEECHANPQAGTVACAYPVDPLRKMFSTKLAERAPAVYAFLQKMSYDNEAHETMLAALDEGQTIEQAAADWIKNNPDIWQKWFP